MKTLKILYCSDNPELEKEAQEMAKFLRENLDSPCRVMLVGFHYEPGGATDQLIDTACATPLIEKQIIPARQPINTYIKGIEGLRKHIELIKEYVRSHQ